MSVKVLTNAEMRETEQLAIKAGYPSLLLMEHAAGALVDVLEKELNGCRGKHVLFLCGKGNNGGDGLAAARLFRDRGGEPVVFLTEESCTDDSRTNLRLAYLAEIPVVIAAGGDPEEQLQPYRPDGGWDGFVDALYGTGFSGRTDELTERLTLLPLYQERQVPVIAADVPSGLNALTGECGGCMMKADVTVTFHAVKPGLVLTKERDRVGRLAVKDIGLEHLDEEIVPNNETVILAEGCDLLLPERGKVCHKGDMGRLLIYAGSPGMAGAAAICARAAVKAGAGLTTLMCPGEMIPILQTLVPCAMCRSTEEAKRNMPAFDVLCLGCGLGQQEEIWQNILQIWDAEKPSVWDADALNLLARHPMHLGELAVITPHIGEAARLLNETAEAVFSDRIGAAERLRKRFGCQVVLKSDVTVVKREEQTVLIDCASPALAKGGSGDALCGILGALLAQDAPDPCVNGPLWHALASRAGAEKYGVAELTAEELILCLHDAEKRYMKA